ncbi:MAG: AAA family ATPase [Gallionellaceae bacterium]|nr:AAA family ATPase [Gallionellaceae bacterium]
MSLPRHLERLLDAAAYPHPAGTVRLIETHISWVLIAGEYAYKIKKPVNFGFLDFSTLARRRFCCEEEIRLNRRLAPATYLDVVPVTASGPDSAGEVLDWAVRMRAFPSDATLDREAAVTPQQIDAIADQVARFHGEIEQAPESSDYGSPEAAMYPVRENFRQARGLAGLPDAGLDRLEAWSEGEYQRLHDHFAARKATGFIRECHGDLHPGNIAWVNEAPLIFDCIEFNPNLRFVDVVSEVAFLCMDLIARDLAPLAWRFLNRYLEQTGDYAGLAALRFYLVYRAMVRAKVAGLRAGQGDLAAQAESLRYLDLAERLARPGRPALLLMHGYSGSGKTWLSQLLLEGLEALRVRSDVERKRLHNLHALADSKETAGNIYTPEATRRTFKHLKTLAARLLAEGYIVIVDATFLGRNLRTAFVELAESSRVDWQLVSLPADVDLLRQRISHRLDRADDASEADLAVLESQLAHSEPLSQDELAHQVSVAADDDGSVAVKTLRNRLGL